MLELLSLTVINFFSHITDFQKAGEVKFGQKALFESQKDHCLWLSKGTCLTYSESLVFPFLNEISDY